MALINSELRHTARIYPEIQFIDSRGNPCKGPSPEPVEVRCTLNPSKARNDLAENQSNDTEFKFYAEDAPLGIWSKVEWNNRIFIVASGPYLFDRTSGTHHVEATLHEVR